MVNPLRLLTLLGLLGMIPIVFSYTTLGTWDVRTQRNDGGWSGGFYNAQAEAMIHGRLDVDRKAIQGECFDYQERCYGYFGITPSLIRVPLLGVLRLVRSALTPIFLSVAILLAYWATLRLVEQSISTLAPPGTPTWLAIGYHAAAVVALGPGSTLIFLTRPAVYEEAAAWGIAFFLLTMLRVWEWLRTQATRHLAWALLLAGLAANARLTAALACVVLGALVMMFAWRRRARAALALGVCLAIIPAATTAGVFVLKFGTPAPDWRLNEQIPEAGHWRDILARNGDRITSVIFAPTALVAYFRPDAVSKQPGGLHFDFRFPRRAPMLWVPPLPPRGAYVERVTSLTATMPWPWAVTLVMLIALPLARQRLPRDAWLLLCGFMLSTIAMIVPVVTHFGIANRYLAEFFPLGVVGMVAGGALILPSLAQRPKLAAITAVFAASAIVWAVLVTWSLTLRLLFKDVW